MMLTLPILRALAEAIDSDGDEMVALSGLRRIDPVLRFVARRKLRLALTDALLTEPPPNSANHEPEEPSHVLRLAYLALAGAPHPPPGSIATIRAFQRCRRAASPMGSTRWWLTGVLALLATLAISCGSVLGYRALRGEPRLLPDPPAPAAGAFATGGVPARGGPVLDQALGRDLPAFLIALDAWRRARGQSMPTSEPARRLAILEDLQDRLQARPVRRALGAQAARWLNWLLRLVRVLATTRQLDRLIQPYVQVVVALNDALAARGLGYYLDSELVYGTGDVRHVILYVFRVERVQRFSAGGRIVKALQLRRLDKLNWAHGALGFTRPDHREALVLLNAVDEILVTYLLPALGTSRMVLTDGATDRASPRWSSEIASQAARVIRAELARIPGLKPKEAQRLSALLARRRAILERWQTILGKRGYGLVEPTGLTFGWNYRRALKNVIDAKQLDDMAQLEQALRAPRMRRTLATLRDVVASSVAHHETQHRLDYDRIAGRTLPKVLRRRLGPLVQGGRVRRRVRRARDELSAYLGELARARLWTQMDLALIARFVFDQGHAGSAEYHAARVILEGLAKRCGLVLVTNRRADRARYAMLYLQLTRQDPRTLRQAARRLYKDLFGTELPTLREL